MTHVLGEPIPDALARQATSWGDAGARWLRTLPGRVGALVDRWSLGAEHPLYTTGNCSLVVPVRSSDGLACVLKVQWPHPEAECEADALRAYDGDGAVRLLASDDEHFALLIERCEPGTLAWETDDVLAVCASLMRRLWRPVPDDAPFDRASLAGARAAKMRERFEAFGRPFDEGLAREGADLFDSLSASAPREVLLHGDFHPYNVLRAQREPWLVIDPKPLVGDPAFDCAQLLLNLAWRGSPVEPAIAALADAVGVERERAWAWTFARTVEEITWSLAGGWAVESFDRAVERARYFASLRP